jgi:hypothetical protein
MTDPVAIAISALALSVSSVTAWLTLFRRGTVKMTQPTVIFFGPDAPHVGAEVPLPKVFLRTLLFSTSKRGRVIECMYVALSRNETRQNFNVWVYGADKKLVRGSGLFVGETGVEANHHFLTPRDDNSFRFTEGRYTLKVFARLLADSGHIRLFSQTLEISREIAVALTEPHAGVYFDWGPDSSRYLPHIEKRPPSPDPRVFLRPWGFDSCGIYPKSNSQPRLPTFIPCVFPIVTRAPAAS